jgi:hypothetical protein
MQSPVSTAWILSGTATIRAMGKAEVARRSAVVTSRMKAGFEKRSMASKMTGLP